ncbi:hypothetical protein T459_03659 [Capsicum annuum]|uniref:Vta1/callose synthase N-terminal domain-containing protein n=1 Tax=Capsicum annuum TaxID=4072 RepID=A0A2G3ANG0_CAPAN|nr:hypothetical protein T459_03659 [Capsicum annuum]
MYILEILEQFGELQRDLQQKHKYAVWKAADIRKAIKERQKPVPGPPGGDDDFSLSGLPGGESDNRDFSAAQSAIEPFYFGVGEGRDGAGGSGDVGDGAGGGGDLGGEEGGGGNLGGREGGDEGDWAGGGEGN